MKRVIAIFSFTDLDDAKKFHAVKKESCEKQDAKQEGTEVLYAERDGKGHVGITFKYEDEAEFDAWHDGHHKKQAEIGMPKLAGELDKQVIKFDLT